MAKKNKKTDTPAMSEKPRKECSIHERLAALEKEVFGEDKPEDNKPEDNNNKSFDNDNKEN